MEVVELLFFQLANMLDSGMIPNYQTSMEKVFLCEYTQRLCNTAMEILGQKGQLKTGSRWAALSGNIEHFYRFTVVETIISGTSEIQRNIIAQRGLGMPRA